MDIGILGINHKSADLRLREKLAKVAERLFGHDHALHSHFSSVLLSTCNRTEIYFNSDNPAQTHTYLLHTLRERIEEEFEHRIYSYFGADCFLHLARVTAGIDSALIFETEIQGQVKRAYETAHLYRPLAPELHFLFQKCLKIGKNARAHHPHCNVLPSIEETILDVAMRLLGTVLDKKILFVGLSEINHKIFSRFKKAGCRHLYFCNRSFEKASEFAKQESIKLLPWEDLEKWIGFDIAIFGTKSPNFLVYPNNLRENMRSRLVIDLSVPRNVHPKIGCPFLTLLNVDQLNRAIDRRRKVKAAEMARAEASFITKEVEKLTALFQLKGHSRNLFYGRMSEPDKTSACLAV